MPKCGQLAGAKLAAAEDGPSPVGLVSTPRVACCSRLDSLERVLGWLASPSRLCRAGRGAAASITSQLQRWCHSLLRRDICSVAMPVLMP